jgi:hypothetical protein
MASSRTFSPLVIKAAQAYYKWAKADAAGETQDSLKFFAEYDIWRGKVFDHMRGHRWPSPLLAARAEREIFDAAVHSLARAELHRAGITAK